MSISERAATPGCLPTRPRRRHFGRLGLVATVVVLLGGGVPAARWWLAKRSLAWQARRGLQMLDGADTPAKIRAALDHWESETHANWEPQGDDFITHLYTQYPLEDQRVRLLLTRVAGADYGPRREDWQRWHDTRRRLRAGLPLKLARREAVSLKPLWQAPVGLTAWFSTILPLDGQVYVASLGKDFGDSQDTADGVVRVDGRTGAAEVWFVPPSPQRGPRDVIGVAAGDETLFVACYNGFAYCVDGEARLLWHMHVGDPIVAPPLSADLNRDGMTDVVVATRGGKVVALSGRQGRTMWVASVARPAPGEALLGATLALGNVLGRAEPELMVTMPSGAVEVLAARSGRSLWRHQLAAGTVAGAVCRNGTVQSGPPAYVGDRGACIWSLVDSERGLKAAAWQVLAVRQDETLVAALRTPGIAKDTPVLLLACLTGDYAGRRGAVCALAPEGVHWRLPVDGAVWGTPAVADLNGDGRPEIVVASIEPRAAGQLGGVLTIVSLTGQCLERVVLDAPLECSPVVADVNGDNRLEVLVADQSGRLHCFGTEGYGPVAWGLFGGDSHNTRNATNAYAYGQVFFGHQWKWKPE